MTALTPASAVGREEWPRLQRRTMATLRLAEVPGQAAVAGVVAVVTLLAKDMLDGNDRLAGSGGAALTLGSAFLAVPLAAYMRRHGRRPGLMIAFGLGSVGALVAGTGGQARWFWLFIVGMALFGGAQAATLQGRYVAADLAPEHERAKAIAAIVWVGTLGAIFGPILTPWEKRVGEALGLDEFVGPFLFAAAFLIVSLMVISTRLHPDPLAVTGQLEPNVERSRPLRQVRISAGVIRGSSLAPLGLAAMVVSQTSMVAVMTMTPPHMKDHDHADMSAYVIAVHIVGMYAFAPLVGRLVARIGAIRAIIIGSLVLGAGTVAAVLGGYVPVMIFAGLFLLGVGWSIGLIAGSTLLTNSVPIEGRVEVQGTADLTMSFCGGTAAFFSGFVKHAWGFTVLADIASMLAIVLLALAATAHIRHRRIATAV